MSDSKKPNFMCRLFHFLYQGHSIYLSSDTSSQTGIPEYQVLRGLVEIK